MGLLWSRKELSDLQQTIKFLHCFRLGVEFDNSDDHATKISLKFYLTDLIQFNIVCI